MAITTDALAQSTYASKTAATGDARTKLAENFSQFLTLLTTQLQNQDPTNPMDTNEFTNQLVMFSQVEQQIDTNKNLEELLALNRTSQITSLAPMVGKQVEIDGPDLPLQNGTAQLGFNNPDGYSTARVLVTNASGSVVRDETVSLLRGQQWIEWDGRDGSGNQLADGAYKVAVRAILPDGTEKALDVKTRGTVTAAERSGSSFVLLLGEGVSVSPDKVRALTSS